MTVAELDRLVNQTELTPLTKHALRGVRKAVMSGRASDPEVHRYDWTIGVETRQGTGVRFSFSLRKADPNGARQERTAEDR
jgi:hypothetical protein